MGTRPPETLAALQATAAHARSVQQRNAALRAIDDPVKLQWAARIVRAALERNDLTLADLAPEGGTDAAA